jgi:hypothetical protein
MAGAPQQRPSNIKVQQLSKIGTNTGARPPSRFIAIHHRSDVRVVTPKAPSLLLHRESPTCYVLWYQDV